MQSKAISQIHRFQTNGPLQRKCMEATLPKNEGRCGRRDGFPDEGWGCSRV